ncbi:MAG: prepilin-type N-terminal cleavage/methylation domain-containing protein [Myxococcaceae bacterium]
MNRGFTLLETVVAMAILALALMAIFDLNAGAVSMHAYTKKLTVASMLARAKMTDIEQKLYDEGFPVDDEEESGDFDEEGWPSFKWRARILAPDTSNLDPMQVMSAVLGVPMGMGEGGDSSDPMSMISGLFGGNAGGKGGDADSQSAGGMAGMLGGAAGLAQGQFQQMVTQIGQSVREVQLTVYWKDGTQVESIDLVTHVVSQGQGGDRNVAGTGSTDQADPWVDAQTGQPVADAVQAPGGSGMQSRSTGRAVIRLSQLNSQKGGVLPGNGTFQNGNLNRVNAPSPIQGLQNLRSR